MSKNHKKVCRFLNYIGHSGFVILTITWWIFISVFASFDGILIRITSSAIGLKICAITAETKRYKSKIKK